MSTKCYQCGAVSDHGNCMNCGNPFIADHKYLENAARMLLDVDDDPKREGLQETPERFARAWKFWTSGYELSPKDALKTFGDGGENYDEMVFQRDIPVWSLCEHHLAPFFGVVHIAYIPHERIVGLSKLARLVDVFARRLQVQERLTAQIANSLNEHLTPRGVGVVLECRHTCMESRGIQKAGTITITSATTGSIREDPSARSEFLAFVTKGKS